MRMRIDKTGEKQLSCHIYNLRIPEGEILSCCQNLLPFYEDIQLLHSLTADYHSAFE